MFISQSAAWHFKFTQYLMPSPAADVSKEHLKFDSSVIGNGDNLGLDWLQCNYELLGAYQQFTSVGE